MCYRFQQIMLPQSVFYILIGLAVWISLGCGTTFALPPLGLTLVDSSIQPLDGILVDLTVIDSEAFISTNTGVWRIDSTTNNTYIPISHSQFGIPSIGGLTQVIKAMDQQLYLAGDFNQGNAGALFRLDNPSFEIVTWTTAGHITGVDRNLRSLGRGENNYVTEFLSDGSANVLGVPVGCTDLEFCRSSQRIVSVTPSGYAFGEVFIPGTAGTGQGLWEPDGSVSILRTGFGFGGRIADRNADDQLNIAFSPGGFSHPFKLGTLNVELIEDADGNLLPDDGSSLVTQTDLVVILHPSGQNFAYYPGIVEGSPQAAVNLLEVFPELATVDINRITDIYTVDRHVYMTVYGDDGLYLFGALDPSVVPEPSTLALLVVSMACCFSQRRTLRNRAAV